MNRPVASRLSDRGGDRGEQAFDDFIGTGKRAKHHKLIVIGSDTAEESSAFAKKYPHAFYGGL